MAVLSTQTEPLTVADLKIKIDLHRRLGQATAALKAYRALLSLAPHEGEWRLALAQLLFDQGKLDEARKELRIPPGPGPAQYAGGSAAQCGDPGTEPQTLRGNQRMTNDQSPKIAGWLVVGYFHWGIPS